MNITATTESVSCEPQLKENNKVLTYEDMSLEEAEILNSFVTPEILECLREAKLAKERDAKEELELHRIAEIHLEELLGKDDLDGLLNQFVDLTARLDDGIADHINPAKAKQDELFEKHPWFWKLYVSWRAETDPSYRVNPKYAHKFGPEVRKRFLSDPRNSGYIRLFEHISMLWKHWFKLKGERDTMATEFPCLWPKWYELRDKPLVPYFIWGGKDLVDDDDRPDTRMEKDSTVVYGDTHCQEPHNRLAYEDLEDASLIPYGKGYPASRAKDVTKFFSIDAEGNLVDSRTGAEESEDVDSMLREIDEMIVKATKPSTKSTSQIEENAPF